MKLESGGPAVRSSTVLTTPADLLARPAPLGLGDARVRVASSLADLTRRPDPQAAWIVPSFQLVDELVRRGVDSSHVLVVDPLLLRSPELSTAVFSYGDVLVPGAPHRFPGRDLVVVPTYNERECLPIVLAQIPRFLHCDVLVVDDGSPDGTGELADRIAAEQPFVHVLHRTRKQGLGKAYVAGFRWGLERGYDRLYEMDADQSHAPWDLPRLAFASQTADLVIGSRDVKGCDTRGWSWKRGLLSR